MKIKYEFANEVIEIEVSEEWGNVLLELDRLEYNNNKTETRRHYSLNTIADAGAWLMDESMEPCACVCEKADLEMMEAKVDMLSRDHAEIIRTVCLGGMTLADYATKKGITRQAASQKYKRAKKNLKKFF